MTVILNNYRGPVSPDKMIEGKAYIDDQGIIYICNKYESAEIVAFSICGNHLIVYDSPRTYYDCKIEINRLE